MPSTFTKPTWFSRRVFAVPFGHYETGADQEPPANEILIGREGQRAYFIDLLMNMGRRGAYLVTGRRGAGKTSFVRHCVAEYKAEVYGRYVRSSVGRALFWDRLIVLLLFTAVILGALLLSQLLDILVRAVSAGEAGPRKLLLWLLITPIALLCVYPLLYAKDLLEVVVRAVQKEENSENRRHRLIAVAATLGFAVLAWFAGPFGSPALGMSRLFAAIAGLFVLVQILSYRRRPEWRLLLSLKANLAYVLMGIAGLFVLALSYRRRPGFVRRLWRHLLPLAAAASYLHIGADDFGIANPESEYSANLGLGLLLAAAGLALRGLYQNRVVACQKEIARVKDESSLWYALAAVLMGAAGLSILLQFLELRSAIGVASVPAALFLLGIVRVLMLDRKQQVFQPRPLYALSAKAVVSVVLALQLVHPALSRWDRAGVAFDVPGWKSEISTFLRQETSLHQVLRNEKLFHGKAAVTPLIVQGTELQKQPGGVRQELNWILTVLLIASLLYFLEFEWVVRPFLRQRIDPAFADKPGPWDDQEGYKERVDRRKTQRSMAGTTFPWTIYRLWLPVLVLSVNLGFDRLDHRRVVHAMLAALRDEYHRTFLSWSSALANLGRLVALLLILAMVTLVGEQLFAMPDKAELVPRLDTLAEQSSTNYDDVCAVFTGRQTGPSAVNLVCSLPGGSRLFHILYFDLLTTRPGPASQHPSNHLLFWFLPYQDGDFPGPELQPVPRAPLQPLLKGGMHFRIYHLLLLLLLLLAARWSVRHLPVLPYHETLRRLDSMLDSLSSRTSTSSKQVRSWQMARWLQGYFQDENVRQVQQDPIDPRTLEFAFLTILHDMQHAPLRLPGAKNQLISLPTPEITYVFDELDKLGTRMGPAEAAGGEKQEAEILDAARRRSIELHRLLANMKNLLSSAPARFIFVGGRNLHDEWLADQTARHPLLTNIFNAEVYLPSLLTDHPWQQDDQPKLHTQIERYLLRQWWRAQVLYCRWAKARWLPSFGQPIREPVPESFMSRDVPPVRRLSLPMPLQDLSELGSTVGVLQCEAGPNPDGTIEVSAQALAVEGGLGLLQDFVYFMTYRSMGNPKRLKELLAVFVRPVSRAVQMPEVRWSEGFDCRHVLAFGDVERFRVQLLADIYRHLALTFEKRLVVRDDKLAISVFFLADYLFKFHRRAFSWSNLERVDELVDIHRAPDLREILEEIVERWSERFLHPIRNGMYAFRFRSDIAREIEYLSRQSAQEMAAFNFTLDESMALKSLYASKIQRLGTEARPELQDLLAGLGELHEFDQEYEPARQHYREAIRLLDVEFEQVVGRSGGKDGPAPLQAVLGGEEDGLRNARLYLTWGAARLRLVLQVGLTFEFARNFERAIVEYRNARTLSRSLILAMLGETGTWEALSELRSWGDKPESPRDTRLHVLKNLNILFQPVFAEAWVTEKLTGGVDTSVSVVEKEIWQLRTLLPFVQDLKLQLSENPGKVRGSNFALIMAELHNKTGDLYFFKGRQLVSFEDLKTIRDDLKEKGIHKGLEGYLLRAHYHYAMGLHELRRFMTHRRMSSKLKFNIWAGGTAFEEDEIWEPIADSSLPDFVFRSVGGTLNDLAETMLGRVSLYGLFHDLSRKGLSTKSEEIRTLGEGSKPVKSRLVAEFGHWLTHADEEREFPIRIPLGNEDLEAGSLAGWLGTWRDQPSGTNQLLSYDERGHDDRSRLMVSLHLSMMGAKYLERGGYLEDAAREMVEVAEMAAHYLWWGLIVHRLCERPLRPDPEDEPLRLCKEVFTQKNLRHEYWAYLYELAVYSLRKADQLFRRSRREEDISSMEYESDYLLGKKVPPSVLTLACSLGLVAEEIFGADHPKEPRQDLLNLIDRWTGSKYCLWPLPRHFAGVLERSLVRHSYPMINRLQGLKVLIDAETLTVLGGASPEVEGRILSRTQELLTLDELFDAPLHFTPLHAGLTCALVALSLQGDANKGRRPEVEKVWHAAQRYLNKCEEMYTMRRAYYEGISELYYLFDDFNDRQIHFNMAMQMAGTELVSLIKGLLHLPEARKFRTAPEAA
ncbi:MAG TPA: hypothetical protein VN493_07085 [Thermoanaerobaculia bacterium]|nr:hypothetical protein [Thermoanaerobaculia bacterium]